MSATDRHRAAEERFIELLDDAGLPRPDRVDVEPESLVFYWDEPKTAVVVDLEPAPQAGRS
jgi:hypothetical protein